MARKFKFTLVQNPFNHRIEEVQMVASTIPNMFDRYGLVGVLTATGGAYTYDENTTSELGPQNMCTSEPFWCDNDDYDYQNVNLSNSPSGWLVFYETHTRVRKGLYHIFMQLLALSKKETVKYYSVRFIKTEFNNYIGVSQRETSLKVGTIKVPPTLKDELCQTISGGGGGCYSYTVCPIPPAIDLYKLFVYIRKNASVRKHIKCIITSDNYYYGFDDEANIVRAEGPIIIPILDEFNFNMLVIDNSVASDEPHRNDRLGAQMILPSIARYFGTDVLFKVLRQPIRLYSAYTNTHFRSGWVHLFDLSQELPAIKEVVQPEFDFDSVQVGLPLHYRGPRRAETPTNSWGQGSHHPYKTVRVIQEHGEQFLL